jgi:hypothetical protein
MWSLAGERAVQAPSLCLLCSPLPCLLPSLLVSCCCRVIEGMSIVERIENSETGANDRPLRPVVIADCGELLDEEATAAPSKSDESEASSEEPASS